MKPRATLDSWYSRARLVERVAVPLEQRQVGVHARARVLGERLGHERGEQPLRERDLLDDRSERHEVVGRAERVGVAQVDLLLPGRTLVVAELHRDAHRLEHVDRVAPEVLADRGRGVVEVATVVDRHRWLPGLGQLLEEEELDLRVGVEREAHVGRATQGPLEHVARIGEGRRAVRHQDVAEHPGHAWLAAPGQAP